MGKKASLLLDVADKLPIMPAAATEFMALSRNPDATMEHMAKAISKDPVLVLRVIKLANSPFYGHAGRVKSLLKALLLVGANATRSIIMTSVVRDLFRTSDEFERSLWKHSAASALAAKMTANAVKYQDPEEAFMAGLIRDVGLLVLYRMTPRMIKNIYSQDAVSPLEQEETMFGINHARIGKEICKRWNFPDEIVSVVSQEFDACSSVSPLAIIVGLAVKICRNLGISCVAFPDIDLSQFPNADRLGLTDAVIEDITAEIASAFEGGADISSLL